MHRMQIHDRLRWAREQAGYTSASSAAEAMGVPSPTYMAHENGSRGFRSRADRYATFYRVSLHWLLTGVGSARGGDQVQSMFEQLPPEDQRQAIEYLEFLRNRRP